MKTREIMEDGKMTSKTKLAAARDGLDAANRPTTTLTGKSYRDLRDLRDDLMADWIEFHQETVRSLLDQAIGEETDAPTLKEP